jgi:N-acetyl-gamma-glutamyl-phosphate reductase
MHKVFIDGSAGTTGLKILDRLSKRQDIELITLPEQLRKDLDARKQAINSADVAFLCLPDSAAIEAVSLIENPNTAVIDTSTAHRTNSEWTYGFPEIKGLREKIINSKRIANPGCHASGFIALVQPLVEKGLINKDAYLTCFSITGYTGGGKKMIAEYEEQAVPELYKAPRQYGLTQTHKHLPEMSAVCGLNNSPIFCPIVADFDRGMEVTVPLFAKDLNGSIEDVIKTYKNLYTGEIVKFVDQTESGFLSANAMKNKDGMQILVQGNDQRILLIARFDNLGKGASGAAIQNMNVLIGAKETEGLEL